MEENKTYEFSNSAIAFDKKLFQEILTDRKDENIILSSQSVNSVLSMLLIGAKGKTFEELSHALTLPCGENITKTKEMYLENYKSAHAQLKVMNESKTQSVSCQF